MAESKATENDVRTPAPAVRDGEWKRSLAALAGVIALSLLVRSTLLESFSVPTYAMAPSLLPGDIVLVNKQVPPPSRTPAYGSIVVFLDDHEGERYLVRRVIGRPGDRIRITARGRVLRNGKFVTDPWTKPSQGAGTGFTQDCASEQVGTKSGKKPGAPAKSFQVCREAPELPDQATLTVPKDHVFVLGDRRSVPAEFAPQWLAGNRLLLPTGAGLVNRSQVIGSVTRILFSILPLGGEPGMGWTDRIRWDRFWKRIEVP